MTPAVVLLCCDRAYPYWIFTLFSHRYVSYFLPDHPPIRTWRSQHLRLELPVTWTPELVWAMFCTDSLHTLLWWIYCGNACLCIVDKQEDQTELRDWMMGHISSYFLILTKPNKQNKQKTTTNSNQNKPKQNHLYKFPVSLWFFCLDDLLTLKDRKHWNSVVILHQAGIPITSPLCSWMCLLHITSRIWIFSL